MMMYESSTEFNLNRAVENIKLAQQVHKRELENKDEIIQSLHKKIEALQFEGRELSESRRNSEKENRELLSEIQYLNHHISMEQADNEKLKDEMNRLRAELSAQVDKITHLETEHEKANHIIKNLLKKFQIKPASLQPKSI